MQQVPTESSEQQPQTSNSTVPLQTSQYGFLHQRDPAPRDRSRGSDSSASLRSVRRDEDVEGVDPDHLDEKLRGLSLGPRKGQRSPAPGQRIWDYENALTPPTPKQALGFRVIKRSDSRYDGVQVEDFPNGMHSTMNIGCDGF